MVPKSCWPSHIHLCRTENGKWSQPSRSALWQMQRILRNGNFSAKHLCSRHLSCKNFGREHHAIHGRAWWCFPSQRVSLPSKSFKLVAWSVKHSPTRLKWRMVPSKGESKLEKHWDFKCFSFPPLSCFLSGSWKDPHPEMNATWNSWPPIAASRTSPTSQASSFQALRTSGRWRLMIHLFCTCRRRR